MRNVLKFKIVSIETIVINIASPNKSAFVSFLLQPLLSHHPPLLLIEVKVMLTFKKLAIRLMLMLIEFKISEAEICKLFKSHPFS